MSNQNNIYPKDCSYGCGIRIYWNTAENTFFELLSQKKHICPNSIKKSNSNSSSTNVANSYNNYTRKPWNTVNKPKEKEKMSNSFELLSGPVLEVQRLYEVLSDIIIANNGKVHGSQRDRSLTGTLDLIV